MSPQMNSYTGCLQAGRLTFTLEIRQIGLSSKDMNRQMRARNGNGQSKILKVIHWNGGARLWLNKKVELEALMSDYVPDICFISEANWWNDTSLEEGSIPGYNTILANTMSSLNHSRLVALTRENLEVEVDKMTMDKEVAEIWLKVGSSRKNSLLVGGCYRQHHILGRDYVNSSRMEIQNEQEVRWARFLRRWKIRARNRNCVVLGDFNLDHLRWDSPEPHLDSMVEDTKDVIENSGFLQIVTNYTRTWRAQADSLLDHIWTNCPQRTLKTFNCERGASDHNVVGLEISTCDIITGSHNTLRRSWKKFDLKRCTEKFRQADYTDIMRMTDARLAASQLEDLICKIMDSEAPLKMIQTRSNYRPWVSDTTKSAMSSRDLARTRAKVSDSDSDWAEFRRQRNLCTKLLRNDRTLSLKLEFDKIEQENDSSKLFSTTKNLLNWKCAGPPKKFCVDGIAVTKQKEMANLQAQCYFSKIERIKNELPKVNYDPLVLLKRAFSRWEPLEGRPTFSLKSATQGQVAGIIKKMKKSHAFGTDKIDAETLKIGAQFLIPAITHTINLSLGTGVFPPKWKTARILPLLKDRDLDDTNPNSYRPISLLPIISKISERIVQVQLLEYLEKSKQLHTNHHSYRSRTSTTTALLQMMDRIAEATDENRISATMCTDLSAAFDCVEHDLLLQKLKFYGLDATTENWIKDYLDARSFFVTIGGTESLRLPAKHGVPQGSVMGPLLYLIYVNELPTAIEDDFCGESLHRRTEHLFTENCDKCGQFTLYADDGLYSHDSGTRNENQDKIDINYTRIKDFLESNGLKVNEGKTKLQEFMTYQKRTKLAGIPPDLSVRELVTDRNGQKTWGDRHITDSVTTRMLGLNLNGNLGWDSHVTNGKKALLPALRRRIGMISRLGDSLSIRARLHLVNALVLSRLTYGLCVWGNTCPKILKQVQIVMNTASRMINNRRKTTRQSELMKDCKWLKIEDLVEQFSLVQMWKTVWWNTPHYMDKKIKREPDCRISTPAPRLLLTSRAYRWNTVSRWNSLPDRIRTEDSLYKFKKSLKTWLRERPPEGRPPDLQIPDD